MAMNYGEYQEQSMYDRSDEVCMISPPSFLLVQLGEIIAVSDSPVTLPYTMVSRQASFSVMLGITNEFGRKEIIGPCAQYLYRPFAKQWRLKCDGMTVILPVNDHPGSTIRDRLMSYKRVGRLSDPLNFCCLTMQAEVDD